LRCFAVVGAACLGLVGLAVAVDAPVVNEPSTVAELPFEESPYVPNSGCTGCHVVRREELVKNWRASAHAKATPAADASGIELYRTVTGLLPDGSYEHVGVGCQMCHGPGLRHDESSQVRYILRPQLITPRRAIMVCGQCHATGTTADGIGVPTGYLPGLDLGKSLTLTDDATGPRARYNEFMRTKHGTASSVTCTSCHNPHGGDVPHSLKLAEPDKLCAGCHTAGSAKATTTCTSGATGSCTGCHMPEGSHDVRASVR